jgi:hypothetical protein
MITISPDCAQSSEHELYFVGHHGLAAAIAVNGQLTEEWPSSGRIRSRMAMYRDPYNVFPCSFSWSDAESFT